MLPMWCMGCVCPTNEPSAGNILILTSMKMQPRANQPQRDASGMRAASSPVTICSAHQLSHAGNT